LLRKDLVGRPVWRSHGFVATSRVLSRRLVSFPDRRNKFQIPTVNASALRELAGVMAKPVILLWRRLRCSRGATVNSQIAIAGGTHRRPLPDKDMLNWFENGIRDRESFRHVETSGLNCGG